MRLSQDSRHTLRSSRGDKRSDRRERWRRFRVTDEGLTESFTQGCPVPYRAHHHPPTQVRDRGPLPVLPHRPGLLQQPSRLCEPRLPCHEARPPGCPHPSTLLKLTDCCRPDRNLGRPGPVPIVPGGTPNRRWATPDLHASRCAERGGGELVSPAKQLLTISAGDPPSPVTIPWPISRLTPAAAPAPATRATAAATAIQHGGHSSACDSATAACGDGRC